MSHDDFVRRRYLDDLWRRAAGRPEVVEGRVDLDQLRRTEWSEEFEVLMRNRLVFGAIRYGKLRAPGKPKYDRVKSMMRRLKKYAETGNQEMLVDVANLALLEFVEGDRPDRHFAAEDDGEHVEVK